MQRRALALLLSRLALVAAHGILTIPLGRPQTINPQGVKLSPFSDARIAANEGCGGSRGAGQGNVRIPTQAFAAGTPVQIQWQLTIPHNADRIDTGVRIALHYDDEDSFECNILRGGLEGDPDFFPLEPGGRNQVLSAGPADALANSLVSTLVYLPNKTCDYCVLQWTWAARVRASRPSLPRVPRRRKKKNRAAPSLSLVPRRFPLCAAERRRLLHQLRRHRHH